MLLDTPRGKGAGQGVEVADAARFAEAAREGRRCEAASATRKEGYTARTLGNAARPSAGDTKGGDSNEICPRTVTPGVRCRPCADVKGQSHRQADDHVFGKKEAERLRGEELEKYMLSPIDIEGIIGVLAWSACDDEGRRRFVAVKRKKTTRVANVK